MMLPRSLLLLRPRCSGSVPARSAGRPQPRFLPFVFAILSAKPRLRSARFWEAFVALSARMMRSRRLRIASPLSSIGGSPISEPYQGRDVEVSRCPHERVGGGAIHEPAGIRGVGYEVS